MNTLKAPVTQADHIQGNVKAPITLLEYGDYECPYCGLAYFTIKRVQKHFGKKLRFVFRNFPLAEVHPHAEIAAEVAEFAGDKGRFWEMHDLIYENQSDLSLALLIKLTTVLKLSPSELENALEMGKYRNKVKSDFLGGVRSGVNGTPTFFINDQRYNGAFEFKDLVYAIDQSILIKL